MRIAMAAAVALLVGTCAACGTAPPPKPVMSTSERVLQLEQRTVALVKDRDGELGAYCTGVWVGSHAILTANHCVRELNVRGTVAYSTRADVDEHEDVVGVHAGVLVARDEQHDLALIRDAGAPAHGVAGVSSPVVGQNAYTTGHPLGLWWSYSQGQVAGIRLRSFGDEDAMWWVQTTAPVSPGNSGGGLFDDDGNVIGICHGVLTRGENLNLFVHSRHIVDFLKDAAK